MTNKKESSGSMKLHSHNKSQDSNAKIDISIVIVNFNYKYFMRLAVDALNRSKTDKNFEIIIVDNASLDDSIGYLSKAQEDGHIKLVKAETNLGFGKGNNLGAQFARGKYIYLHNPDIQVQENSLQDLFNFAEENPEYGIIGPKLMYHNEQIQPSCRTFMTFLDLIIKRTFLKSLPYYKKRYEKFIMKDFDHKKTQPVDLITGAFMVLPRDLYEKVGGFDPMYFLFMEDFDLCQKVWWEGRQVVYYPEVTVFHYHKRLSGGSLFGQFFKKTFWWHIASAFKYFKKFRGRKSARFAPVWKEVMKTS